MKKRLVTLFFTVMIAGFSFSQNSASEYYESALINDSLKDYKAALKDLDNAIEAKLNFDSAYCLKGIIYFKMGDYKLAIKTLDKAVKANPNYFEAVYTRGITKAQLEDYVGA